MRRLGPADGATMQALNQLFATAFDDPQSYASGPSEAYLNRTLGRDDVVVLVIEQDDEPVGGLVAYRLDKLERERSELYIYDLAVAEPHRRKGIATALIDELKRIAADCGAWVIYVQADYGDDPAIALYTKLGMREDVMHFDITPEATT